MADAGYDVTLFAPDAPEGTTDGVQLIAIPREQGRVRRLVLGNLRLFRKLLAHKADVYHFHDPELLPLGLLLRLARRRVVYDAHEHVRFSISNRDYLPRPAARIVARATWLLEQLASRLGAHVVAATPTIAAQFRPDRCTVVGNYPNLREFEKALTDKAHRDTSIGVYIGGLSKERCLEEVYEALDIVRRSDDRLTLVMAGPVDGGDGHGAGPARRRRPTPKRPAPPRPRRAPRARPHSRRRPPPALPPSAGAGAGPRTAAATAGLTPSRRATGDTCASRPARMRDR